MNPYQLELAVADRKRSVRVRIVSTVAAAVLIALAMWSAGVPNSSWFAWLHNADEVTQPTLVPATQATSSVPEPQKNGAAPKLRLLSTSPGRNASEGAAQIQDGVGDALTYAAGALLANGTVLTEVHADHVILTRGSEQATLYLDGVAEYAGKKRASSSEALLAAEPGPAVLSSRKAPPPTYTEILRGAPRFENDQIIGFDVYPGTNAGQFSRMGLQSGDLLVAIDGAPLSSAEALNAALKNIGEGRSVVATVRRGAEQIDVSLDGGALAANDSMASVAVPTHP